MYELCTLGKRDLRVLDDSADPAGARALLQRPKHLALLVYFALQNGSRCRRDTVLALFWPEADESHARNALSKTLGRISRALGDGVIQSLGAHELGLRPGAVQLDVDEFRRALRVRDWARAIALYAGDFLPGFNLPTAPAFDSWMDEMRSLLRADAFAAAQRLADEQEQRGEPAAAVASLRVALGLAPTNESVARRLMSLLHRMGERAAALQVFQSLEQLLRTELDAAPEEETLILARRTRVSSTIGSVAVLSWANLTGSEEQEHVSDGLTDLVITELARTRAARITSRQSSLHVKGATLSLAELGKRLGVEAVVEGTVTRYGDWLTVTAQLIRLNPEEHLWAERFEATLGDMPNLAERIALMVADCLRGRSAAPGSTAHARRQAVMDPAALEAYLRGRHFSVMLPQLGKAVAAYREAIERAPMFAPAWAGLASVYATLTLLAHAAPADLFAPFRQAAEQAVSLDPQLGEAHTSLACYRMLAERDWAEAEASFRRGAELAAGTAEPHIQHAIFLAAMGRFREAGSECGRALELDPLGPGPHFCGAWCDYKAGAHAESLRKLGTLLELHPQFAIAFAYVAVNRALLGQTEEAVAAARLALEHLPNNPEALALGIAALGRAGRAADAAAPLAQLRALADTQYLDPWAVGVACTGLGRFDDALHWFRRMYDERSPSVFCIAQDPLLDPLRAEPRFYELIRRLAFPARPLQQAIAGPTA